MDNSAKPISGTVSGGRVKPSYLITIIGTALALVLSLLAFASTSAAVGHPDHGQRARSNGPASTDNGNGRNNPNGSNGTIKIDGIAVDGTFDGHPNNEPHISCVFQVDLYGFDGALNADTAELEFRHWNPSNGKVEITALAVAMDEGDATVAGAGPITFENNRVIVPLGSDGAGGGVDLDRQVLIELDIPATDPGAGNNHGHHVRLDALVESDGRDYKKTKVFWVSGCDDKKAEFNCNATGTTLSWEDQGLFNAGYNVLLDGVVIDSLASDVTAWEAGDLFGSFAIQAINVAGTVTEAAAACVIDPPPAPAFDCALVPFTTTLTWDAVTYNAYESDYTITATNLFGGEVTVTVVPAGTTELTLAGNVDVVVEATWVDGTIISTSVCNVPFAD